MPSLFKSIECASCGRRHDFCLLLGEVEAEQQCDYVCPETGSHTSIRCPAKAEVVHYQPQGAVQLSLVNTLSPAQ